MASGWDRAQGPAGGAVVIIDPNAVRPSGGASAATPCRRIPGEAGTEPGHGPTTAFSSGTDVVDLSELEGAP